MLNTWKYIKNGITELALNAKKDLITRFWFPCARSARTLRKDIHAEGRWWTAGKIMTWKWIIPSNCELLLPCVVGRRALTKCSSQSPLIQLDAIILLHTNMLKLHITFLHGAVYSDTDFYCHFSTANLNSTSKDPADNNLNNKSLEMFGKPTSQVWVRHRFKRLYFADW